MKTITITSHKTGKTYTTQVVDGYDDIAVDFLQKQIDNEELFYLSKDEYCQKMVGEFSYSCDRCGCNIRPGHKVKHTGGWFSRSYSVYICTGCLHEYNLDIYERQLRNYRRKLQSWSKGYDIKKNKMSS